MSKLELIKISGFKNLDDFKVSNLKKINYFIGPSGAGKSSVWELISLISKGSYESGVVRFGDLYHVISDEVRITLVVKDGTNKIQRTYVCRPTSKASLNVGREGDIHDLELPDIQYFSSEVKEQGYRMDKKSVSKEYDPTRLNEPMKKALFTIADDYTDSTLSPIKHITWANNEAEPTVLRGPERDQEMSAANLSGGYSALASLAAVIGNNQGSLIVLEEPENGMHVKLQKSLHGLFKKLVADNDAVQLMIITHSPFLLSTIKTDDTDANTYLIDKGTVQKPEGYGASGARYLAAKLVGLSFEDIAPTKIIICEGSLVALLEKVNERFYYSPIMITSAKSHMGNEASGDEDILHLAEVEEVYKNRFNFFSKSDLIFIIDKPNDTQKKLRNKIDQLLTKDTILIELPEDKLENYYTLAKGLDKVVSDFIGDNTNSKRDRANKLGEHISKDEFERLFPEVLKYL